MISTSLRRNVALLGVLLLWVLRPSPLAVQFPGGNLDSGLPQPVGSPTPSTVRMPPRKGEIFDDAALRRIRSFCLDSSHLSDSEAAGVRQSLTRQGQSRKLSERLSWKLIDDCSQADAVARVYYLGAAVRQVVEAGGLRSSSPKVRQEVDPVLVIYDKAALRLYYRAEGSPIHREARYPLADPLAMLAKDLRTMNQ